MKLKIYASLPSVTSNTDLICQWQEAKDDGYNLLGRQNTSVHQQLQRHLDAPAATTVFKMTHSYL